jgi:WD40 repeat protein
VRTLKLKKLKRVHGLHFAPDGQRLLAVGGEEVRMIDAAVLLDLATGESVARIDQYAQCYAVDPGLTRYILGGANQWDGIAPVQWTPLAGAVEWRKVDVPRGDSFGLAFDASGTRLAVSHQPPRPRSFRHDLIVFRLEPAPELSRLTVVDSGRLVAFNSDATRAVVSGGLDYHTEVDVYDLVTGKSLYRFDPPSTVTRCVLFLPDNRLVVANGRAVYVLPPDRPEPLFTLEGHPKQVNAVALTPDGRRILTASHDGSIRAWNSDTGEPGPRFDWGVGPVTALAFAPDGLTCAAAGLNGKVVLWDVDE